MSTAFLGTAVEDILEAVLDDDPEVLYVVNPSATVFERLTNAALEGDATLPSIRVLGERDVLNDAVDDFLVASTAADLITADALAIRTLPELRAGSTMLGDGRAVALVEAGSVVGGLSTTDADFVDVLTETIDRSWDEADAFSVRTPPISRVRETLESAIGPDVRDDFQAMLDALETVRGDRDDLDEVTVSLLVAAKNGVLLYDISKWGEDVGIASKATFSRTKTKLEDVGLVDTEKVPIEVGRPRLRLRLTDAFGEDDDPETVVDRAIDALAETP